VTNRRADEANKLGVMDLWTPENHYRWSISRYGGHVSASVNPVQGSRLFASSKWHLGVHLYSFKLTHLNSDGCL
jgi:hypothetical protein